jgi:hypothetical protein
VQIVYLTVILPLETAAQVSYCHNSKGEGAD